jgi:hypothetical protein
MATGGGLRFGDQGPFEEFDAAGNRVIRVEIVGDPEASRQHPRRPRKVH